MKTAKKPRVLFVDDEDKARKYFKKLLYPTYDVEVASSGEEAIKRLRNDSTAFCAIVSDERMPGLRGVDLLAQVKESFPEMPRVLTTAFVEIKVLETAINEGSVSGFISKPWVETEIESCLNRVTRASVEEHFSSERERPELTPTEDFTVLGYAASELGSAVDQMHLIRENDPRFWELLAINFGQGVDRLVGLNRFLQEIHRIQHLYAVHGLEPSYARAALLQALEEIRSGVGLSDSRVVLMIQKDLPSIQMSRTLLIELLQLSIGCCLKRVAPYGQITVKVFGAEKAELVRFVVEGFTDSKAKTNRRHAEIDSEAFLKIHRIVSLYGGVLTHSSSTDAVPRIIVELPSFQISLNG
ncbi:MAG: response regulator [Opitutales bacterium]